MTYKQFRKIQIYILILLAIFILNKNFQVILKSRILDRQPVWRTYSLVLQAKQPQNELKPKQVLQKRLFYPWKELSNPVVDKYIKEKQSLSTSKQNGLIANLNFKVKRLTDGTFNLLQYLLVSVKSGYLLCQNQQSHWRSFLLERLEEHLDSRSLSLAAGLLFGDVSGIDRETYHSFKVIGILHILSASGANFTLVIQFFLLLSRPLLPFLSKKQLFGLYLVLGTGYFSLVGGGSAPSRAYWSLVISAYVMFWHLRANHGLYNLILVAFLLLIINPFQLSNLSFQLSFLATLGLLFFSESSLNSVFIKQNYLLCSIAMTASAQFFLVPVLVANFAELNYLTFLANLLVLPLVELLSILFLVLYIAIFIQQVFSLSWLANLLAIFISKVVDILFTLIDILNKIPYKNITFTENKELYTKLFILVSCVVILLFNLKKSQKYSKNIYRVFH